MYVDDQFHSAITVKIIGAGSIGNHLAFACRQLNWQVTVTDIDTAALERMKTQIYPQRYGAWDSSIQLGLSAETTVKNWDVVIIGTPPDTHAKIAKEVLESQTCRILFVEKPFCTPSLYGFQELILLAQKRKTQLLVGYNHCLTANTLFVEELLKNENFGPPLSLTANIQEHWQGIFNAHPWLEGPHQSYLGFFERGGGACGEHSHGISIWQYLADLLNLGMIERVQAQADFVKTDKVFYDRWMSMNVVTSKGFMGHIIQDVITFPSRKNVRIQFEQGFIEWHINSKDKEDSVRFKIGSNLIQEKIFIKTRPDDFSPQLNLMQNFLLNKCSKEETTRLNRWTRSGLHAMKVVAAAYESAQNDKTVKIVNNM